VNDNLYELIQNDNQALNVTETKWKLWNHRLGHLGNDNMKKLNTEEINLKNLKNEFCQDCALGKSKKLPHKTVQDKDTSKIIIHSDLAGPMKTESIGKKRYMVTYICNQTEFSFVYFLRNKNEQSKNLWNLRTFTKIKEMLRYKD
jgi:hypothetical protein